MITIINYCDKNIMNRIFSQFFHKPDLDVRQSIDKLKKYKNNLNRLNLSVNQLMLVERLENNFD